MSGVPWWCCCDVPCWHKFRPCPESDGCAPLPVPPGLRDPPGPGGINPLPPRRPPGIGPGGGVDSDLRFLPCGIEPPPSADDVYRINGRCWTYIEDVTKLTGPLLGGGAALYEDCELCCGNDNCWIKALACPCSPTAPDVYIFCDDVTESIVFRHDTFCYVVAPGLPEVEEIPPDGTEADLALTYPACQQCCNDSLTICANCAECPEASSVQTPNVLFGSACHCNMPSFSYDFFEGARLPCPPGGTVWFASSEDPGLDNVGEFNCPDTDPDARGVVLNVSGQCTSDEFGDIWIAGIFGLMADQPICGFGADFAFSYERRTECPTGTYFFRFAGGGILAPGCECDLQQIQSFGNMSVS